MKVEARWLEGGKVEVLGDFTVLAEVEFTTEGRQFKKKEKLEIISAALYDLSRKPEEAPET